MYVCILTYVAPVTWISVRVQGGTTIGRKCLPRFVSPRVAGASQYYREITTYIRMYTYIVKANDDSCRENLFRHVA